MICEKIKFKHFGLILLATCCIASCSVLEEDDDVNADFQEIQEKAFNDDVDAIYAMYYFNKSLGVRDLEESWAYRGSLAGDHELRNRYVKMYKESFTNEEKKNVLDQLKIEKNNENSKCMILLLTTDGVACD